MADNNIDYLYIGGRVKSTASDEVALETGDIIETANTEIVPEGTKPTQSNINSSLKSQIDALQSQNFVTLTASVSNTTLADVFTGVTIAKNTIYRVANWKGDDNTTFYNTSYYSEYAANDTTVSALVLLDVVNRGVTASVTENSSDLITSGGVYTALDNLSFSTNEKVNTVGIDNAPTADSDNLVKSGGVQNELDKINGTYTIPGIQVSANTRLSKGVQIPFSGKCSVTILLKEGSDEGGFRIYHYVNGGIGSSYFDEWKSFGDYAEITVPETDDGVWLFTSSTSSEVPSARIYESRFKDIEGSLSNNISVLQDDIKDLRNDLIRQQQIYSERQVIVDAAYKRTQSFQVTAGMKLKFCTFVTSGNGTTFTVYHTSVDSSNFISSSAVNTVTDTYTVPEGVETILIFVPSYATYDFILYNADNNQWVTDQVNYLNVFPFVKNYTPFILESDLNVSSSPQFILPVGSGRLSDKEGDIYISINECTAKFTEYGLIQCIATDDTSCNIYTKEFSTLNPKKIFSGKTLKSIYVTSNSVVTAGHLSLSIYSVLQSQEDLSLPLKGNTIMCFGDSITEFRNPTIRYRYSDYLASLSQAKVTNVGIGGIRLAQRETPSLSPTTHGECFAAFDMVNLISAWASGIFDYQDAAINSGLLTQVEQTLCESKLTQLRANPIEGVDIITIFGGTNDYTGGTAIGSISLYNEDKSTLYGAVNTIISALLSAKPMLKIYFFSPIIRMFEQTVSIATSSDVYVYPSAPEGKTLPEFCEIIQDAAKKNHIPFCNWYWSLGWNVYNFTNYFGTDFTHPYNGFNWLGEKMYKFLLSN